MRVVEELKIFGTLNKTFKVNRVSLSVMRMLQENFLVTTMKHGAEIYDVSDQDG